MGEAFGVRGVEPVVAVALEVDESGFAEGFEVLGHAGWGEVDCCCDVTGGGFGGVAEVEDGAPGGIGKGSDKFVEFGVALFISKKGLKISHPERYFVYVRNSQVWGLQSQSTNDQNTEIGTGYWRASLCLGGKC